MGKTIEILVGKKAVMNYVLATLMQLGNEVDSIIIKARGRAISKAVTVAEIIKQKLLKGKMEVKGVRIGSELVGEGENARNVSVIEITLAKPEK